jgi:DNA-binding NarL/FixJ family response regulator
MPRSLRVLLAGDQYVAREGTRSLLDNHGGLEVVGVAADYDRVLAEARRLKPDAVLMEIRVPVGSTMCGVIAAATRSDCWWAQQQSPPP